MKENKYKLPKDDSPSMVAEPEPMYHGNAAVVIPDDDVAVDELDDDDIDWDRIPVGWGPANEEEACARIEAIEADIEKNGLIDAEELDRRLKARFPWLA